MIKVLVVDDHDTITLGISNYFKNHSEIKLVDTAASGLEAIDKLKKHHIDVVVLDIGMPDMDGIECCRLIKKLDPNIKVVAFTSTTDTQDYYDIYIESVDGIILKADGIKELASAIVDVYNGLTVLGSNLGFFYDKGKSVKPPPKLTKREKQVISLLLLGYKRKEVAEKLFISIDTLNTHCKNIFKKLGVNSISELIEKVKKEKLI